MTDQHVACELCAPPESTTSAAPVARPRVLVIDDEAAIRSALGTDGFAVLRQLLRDRPGQTVLVLSCLADVRCKVDCFDLGARDYMTKPFSLDELLARVRNQLRGFDRVIRVGEITLHVGRMEADIGQGPLPLTRLEFLVLKELMEHAGQVLSKGQLLESVWGYDFDPRSNIVGVCVSGLRSKIGDHLIRTVRGEGYRLAAG